jgi:hypothetical protein
MFLFFTSFLFEPYYQALEEEVSRLRQQLQADHAASAQTQAMTEATTDMVRELRQREQENATLLSTALARADTAERQVWTRVVAAFSFFFIQISLDLLLAFMLLLMMIMMMTMMIIIF